jgi:hypothetical protein
MKMKTGWPKILFLLILPGYFFLVGLYKLVPLRPQSIHQWAQCDRASVALNYYQDGFGFFTPKTHNIINGTGITGLEFPLINFLAASGYYLFGFHEYIYRFIVLLIVAFGMIAAFAISKRFISNRFYAVLPPLLLIASPVLTYYSFNFLPESVSLSLSLIAWYFFLCRNDKGLFLTALFCSLAVLIKVTSVINPVAMLASALFTVKSNAIAWYAYAAWLNEHYHSSVFLLHAKPSFNLEEIIAVWQAMEKTWFWRFYSVNYFILLAVVTIPLFVTIRKKISLLASIVMLLYAGAFSFFLLMCSQFKEHDYYIIPLMPALFFHWILLCRFYETHFRHRAVTYTFFVLMAGITGITVSEAKNHIRTSCKKTSWKYSPLYYDRYFSMEQELITAGIGKQDKVISIPDKSPQISLYLMNRKGITLPGNTSESLFEETISDNDFHYLIHNTLGDSIAPSLAERLKGLNCIYSHNGIVIYQINH